MRVWVGFGFGEWRMEFGRKGSLSLKSKVYGSGAGVRC